MTSADRPSRDIHQIVEAIIEQLTTIPGSDVSIKLEIDTGVSSGLDRTKVRTLIENATTLGFIDKAIRWSNTAARRRFSLSSRHSCDT